jgi:hypothetical protein
MNRIERISAVVKSIVINYQCFLGPERFFTATRIHLMNHCGWPIWLGLMKSTVLWLFKADQGCLRASHPVVLRDFQNFTG